MKQEEVIFATAYFAWLKTKNNYVILYKLSPENYKIIPKVSNEVTPRVTLAGIASGLIQKLIQDITTINPDGM